MMARHPCWSNLGSALLDPWQADMSTADVLLEVGFVKLYMGFSSNGKAPPFDGPEWLCHLRYRVRRQNGGTIYCRCTKVVDAEDIEAALMVTAADSMPVRWP